MKKSETALVIAKIIANDGRLAKEDPKDQLAMLEAWHEGIGDLPFADCLEAVKGHYRDSIEWIMVAHIRQRVGDIRRARLAANPLPEMPPEIVGNPRAYADAVNAAAVAIGDGQDPWPVITAVADRYRRELGPE
jgi:hypothetical protein